MKITSVDVRKTEREGSRMRGTATVVLDDCFAVHGIRILEGDKGLFIAMPSKPNKNANVEYADSTHPANKYHDMAHPINKETRAMFQDTILEAYRKALEEETE